jgi:DeoR family glycerol-3-phosphate regulon repressor
MGSDEGWTSLRLNSRQEQLVERLRRDRLLSVSALAEALEVSTETIRRDVRALAAKGVLVKQHGNVLWPENRDDEPLQRRMAANMGAKKRIAQAIAREIKDGESLLIDSGSTTMYVAEALRGHRNLTVVTISAPIAQMLAPGEGNRVFLAGGEVRADDCAAYGPACLAYLGQFSAETAILSAAAISREFGVMDHHMCEVEVCRVLVERAERVIVAADHTKFSAKGLIAACPLAEIDLVVTDAAPPADLAATFEGADVELLIS